MKRRFSTRLAIGAVFCFALAWLMLAAAAHANPTLIWNTPPLDFTVFQSSPCTITGTVENSLVWPAPPVTPPLVIVGQPPAVQPIAGSGYDQRSIRCWVNVSVNGNTPFRAQILTRGVDPTTMEGSVGAGAIYSATFDLYEGTSSVLVWARDQFGRESARVERTLLHRTPTLPIPGPEFQVKVDRAIVLIPLVKGMPNDPPAAIGELRDLRNAMVEILWNEIMTGLPASNVSQVQRRASDPDARVAEYFQSVLAELRVRERSHLLLR